MPTRSLRVEETRPRGEATVQALAVPRAGRDVRRAGEDLLPGQTVLRAGTRIGPAELGVLASLGRSLIRCVRRPRVSVLVTGDELLGLQRGAPGGSGARHELLLDLRPGLLRRAPR